MASGKIRLWQCSSITKMQAFYFFHLGQNLSFSVHNESLCPEALWEVHCPHGRYRAGKPAVQQVARYKQFMLEKA